MEMMQSLLLSTNHVEYDLSEERCVWSPGITEMYMIDCERFISKYDASRSRYL